MLLVLIGSELTEVPVSTLRSGLGAFLLLRRLITYLF